MTVRQKKYQPKKAVDYKVYIMNTKEKTAAILKGSLFLGMVSYLFYESWICFVCMVPYLYFSVKKQQKDFCKKRLEQLRREFKEGIQALQAALDTGYSVENAFVEASKDLDMIYPEGSYITMEFRRIVHGIRMNKTVEEMLNDFACRSGLEEIHNFAEVFSIARRSGGDLLLIISSTAHTIRDKIEVENEIATMMAGKKLEQKIMNIIPFGILLYVKLTSEDFLDVLYGNALGATIMTVCLIVYIVALKLADKIVDVEV